MSKAMEHVDTLISILKEIKETYEYNLLNIEDTEKSLTDLGHEIELSKFNAVQGYKLAKEEQTLRRERRRMKDDNVTLTFLYQYYSNYPNMGNDLQKIRGEIKRQENFLATRLYTPRIRRDLTIPINKQNVTDLQMKFKQAGGM